MMASFFFERESNNDKKARCNESYSAPSYFAEHPFSAISIQKIASNWELTTAH